MKDYSELKKLAQAVLELIDEIEGLRARIDRMAVFGEAGPEAIGFAHIAEYGTPSNTAFVAACNPKLVLQLICDVEALREKLKREAQNNIELFALLTPDQARKFMGAPHPKPDEQAAVDPARDKTRRQVRDNAELFAPFPSPKTTIESVEKELREYINQKFEMMFDFVVPRGEKSFTQTFRIDANSLPWAEMDRKISEAVKKSDAAAAKETQEQNAHLKVTADEVARDISRLATCPPPLPKYVTEWISYPIWADHASGKQPVPDNTAVCVRRSDGSYLLNVLSDRISWDRDATPHVLSYHVGGITL